MTECSLNKQMWKSDRTHLRSADALLHSRFHLSSRNRRSGHLYPNPGKKKEKGANPFRCTDSPKSDGISFPQNIHSPHFRSYTVLYSGELLIHETQEKDAEWSYRCQTRHRLTGEMVVSVSAGKITVTVRMRFIEDCSLKGGITLIPMQPCVKSSF
ncbi:hypothetical protein CDAR_550141 [Caerostris darwini]|uniref:Uncharacterized protein n=1 Tax=Caerostris darwini TaxID=1538125 RepID=A0AAV4PLI4_9ARAC|nr:hypothetical protein CDAR_550141 [Caerostris darwini]